MNLESVIVMLLALVVGFLLGVLFGGVAAPVCYLAGIGVGVLMQRVDLI